MTIQEIRKLTALNRAEFARKYNIPYRTIQDWESGARECPPYVVEMLERLVVIDLKEENTMKNQTLIFEQDGKKMEQKVGTSYPISKENVIKMMEKSGWKLVKTIG